MKKVFLLLMLAMSLVFVSCTSSENKVASDKKEESTSEETTEKKDSESTEKTEDDTQDEETEEDESDEKDKVNINYFDNFKDGEVLAIANITNNNNKQDLLAAYHVKELLLSESADAKEYLVFPKEDKSELIVKTKDADGDGESFDLGKQFGLKLGISDSDLDKYTLTVKNGDKSYDINIKLNEDGSLNLPKEVVEVIFK